MKAILRFSSMKHTVEPDFMVTKLTPRKMIAIVGIRYRNYAVIPCIGVVFLFIGSLSFLFLDDFEKTLTFLSPSNPVPQQLISRNVKK